MRPDANSIVKVGLVQASASADAAANLGKTLAAVGEAAARGAQIICTQELFRTQYFCQSEDHGCFQLAEPVPGPTTEAFQKLARSREVVVIVSLFERRAPGVYHNTAAVIDADGSLLGLYRKMHIPDDPLYYEKFYFTPGDLGFRAWQTRYGKVGVLICWDQWYPEAARLTALRGAEVLFFPTAIGWHPAEKAELGQRQHAAWETIVRGHAIANGCYVAVPNRVGLEKLAGEESSSGARASSPALPAKSWPRPARTARKSWWRSWTFGKWIRPGRNGLSYATAASTHTEI